MVSKSRLYKVIKRITGTDSCLPRVRTTLPWPVGTQKLIKTLKKISSIAQNEAWENTRQKLAHTMKWCILCWKMIFKYFPTRYLKNISFVWAHKEKKPTKAKLLLQKRRGGMHPLILYTMQTYRNPQNYSQYAVNKEDIPVKQTLSFWWQKLASIIVCVDVTSNGMRTPVIFTEEHVKINKNVYLDMLKDSPLC